MAFNIVLVAPEIPNNTGNIGRLSLATGCNLHLVKPLGFKIDDKRLKRAGLDYWQHLSVQTYESIDEFMAKHSDKKLVYFSSHATKRHWDIKFEKELFLVFGQESVGLSSLITQENSERLYKIPMYNERIRSLNLANAVGIVVYEGLRQLGK
ncbi:tRNA (uridine(34)/cytosine(34)/5-carboxymethylaminomethyluridine (34)-2'-O)-methyltransferase TrmL [Croceitalea sp. MTPC9]|uniref:tRNA (cytidine(34)-2'-O)-methyltransferase n=1 Tax=unclassified Croceitalea TaxID=2632280 RepID=UPI002B3BFB9F|nr:tRNA (uridine(34)/cytosine(34)/5-carboxymethylaminomethyluridine (34)-2'-O)-methyltransferase TrmL [Croceitalea sp. MTPC6]GMN18422.1 tRNA (uridine(34)/cytosine(34)/5-carboxymethylaminomethyluridine (34)-2'-O)-methyltransferase TrmL [Croceitalea sp. MTPC9]